MHGEEKAGEGGVSLCVLPPGQAGLEVEKHHRPHSLAGMVFQHHLPLLAGQAWVDHCPHPGLQFSLLGGEDRRAGVEFRSTDRRIFPAKVGVAGGGGEGKGTVSSVHHDEDPLRGAEQVVAYPMNIQSVGDGEACPCVGDGELPFRAGKEEHPGRARIGMGNFLAHDGLSSRQSGDAAFFYRVIDRPRVGRLFRQQLPSPRHVLVPQKAADKAVVHRRIGAGDQAHSHVVGHVASYDGIPAPRRPGGSKVGGFIKPAASGHSPLFQPGEVPQSRVRVGSEGEEGGVGGNHQFPAQPPLEGEPGNAVGLILVVQIAVKGIKAALRDTPGDLPGRPPPLAVKAEAQRFVAHCPLLRRE